MVSPSCLSADAYRRKGEMSERGRAEQQQWSTYGGR